MTGVYKVIVLVFSITVALLSRSPADAVIGSCSVKFFIFGGQSCQRSMMIALKQNPQRSCSVEYDKLKVCLTNHVTDCVKDDSLLKDMADQITRLLLTQAYNCGDQRVNTSGINDFLWTVTKCKQQLMYKAFDCWKTFSANFASNRNNPSELCDPYAEAKRDCTQVAMEACEGLCEYLAKDEYNTFCANRSDPLGPNKKPLYGITATCPDFHAKLDCTDSFVFEKAMECEDQGAEKFANDNDHSCSKEKTRNRQCLEESLNNTCTSNVQLLDETERALQGTLTNERFFCNNVSLDVDLLDNDVKMLADCQPEFFDVAENCAKPFRDDFQKTTSADRKSDETCSEYQSRRECINKARQDFCFFEPDVLEITTNINNPFCSSHATKASLSFILQLTADVILFWFFFSRLRYSTQ